MLIKKVEAWIAGQYTATRIKKAAEIIFSGF
jgi:hypothetical protein